MDAFRSPVAQPPTQRVKVGGEHFSDLLEGAYDPVEERLARRREAARQAEEDERAREAGVREAARAAAEEAEEKRAREEAEAAAGQVRTAEAATGSGKRRVPTVRFVAREGYEEEVRAETARRAASSGEGASAQPSSSREKLMRTNMPLGFGAPGSAASEGRWRTSSVASGEVPRAEVAGAASSRTHLMRSHISMGTDRVDYRTACADQYREPSETAVRQTGGSRGAMMATTMVLGRERVEYATSSASQFVPREGAVREAATDRTELLKTTMRLGSDKVDYQSSSDRQFSAPREGGQRGAVSDRAALMASKLVLGRDGSSWDTEAKHSFAPPAEGGRAAPVSSREKLMRSSGVRIGSGATEYETTAESEFRRSSDYLVRRGEAARAAVEAVGPPVRAVYAYEDAADGQE